MSNLIKIEIWVNNFLCSLAMIYIPFTYTVQQVIYSDLKNRLGVGGNE